MARLKNFVKIIGCTDFCVDAENAALCAAPSSVTTLTSEERRKGIAGFRMNSYGDISHLYAHDEPPAFAARFCECYDNDERHD